jgi:hypothetical protein
MSAKKNFNIMFILRLRSGKKICIQIKRRAKSSSVRTVARPPQTTNLSLAIAMHCIKRKSASGAMHFCPTKRRC